MLTGSSDSFDKIVLSNSVLDSPSEKVMDLELTYTKRFVLKKGTSVQSPWGYKIKRRTISESEQSFERELYRNGSYSIDRGMYEDKISYSVQYLLCPCRVRCTKTLLESLPNFWGYKIQNNPPTIQFSSCPIGYYC